MSTDKFNKWLKKPYLNTSPPRGNQSADWNYSSLVLVRFFIFTRQALERIHHLTRWVHLKHKLSKREYKGVLSKTYGGAILLMHIYQGKREVGFTCRSFDLASPELRVPELEVRAYTSPLPTTNQLHRCGAPLDFPTRRHTKALTLILVCFRSIRFKLSNNQGKLSKQSITADTTIRIVLLTLQGCTATHMKLSVTAFFLDTIQASVGEDNFHNLYLTANSKFNGAAYLGWIPHREPGRFTDVVPEDVCRVPSRFE